MATPALPGDAAAGMAERRGASAQVFVDDLGVPVLDADTQHHLRRVLRLRPGEPVVAADGAGGWRMCRVVGGAGSDAAALEPEGDVRAEPAPADRVTIGFAPVKGERPEWVVQKLTEIGVDRMALLQSARSVVRWHGERAVAATGRLARVAREAAAQSRRVWLPEILGVLDLGALGALCAPGDVWLAEPGAPAPGSGSGIRCLAVGPEGGWDPAELARATGAVRIGPGVLRSETAAVSGGVLLCALRDGLLSSR